MKSFKKIFIIALFGVTTINAAFAQDTTLTVANNTVGIGTTSPRYPLHIVGPIGEIRNHPNVDIFRKTVLLSSHDGKGNSPQLRFFGIGGRGRIDIGQDSTGAFVVEGNDNIRLTIENSGNVGVGTTTPQRTFVVSRDGQNLEINSLDGNLAAVFTSASFTGVGIMAGKESASYIHFGDKDSGIQGGISYDNSTDAMLLHTNLRAGITIDKDSNVGIGTQTPNHPLEMAGGAHVTAGGVWTNASSRALKENISAVSAGEAISALNALEPVQYNYKREKDESYLGFIAEDVPEIVATKDRKSLSPMDLVALLTKVVQEQQKQIEALNARLDGEL